VILGLLSLTLGPPHLAIAQDGVKIFALQKPVNGRKHDVPELHDPLIYGLSWRFKWQAIESQDDRYQWELIDRALEVTRKGGKKLMLRVVAGINTPEWLYQAGGKAFPFSNADLAHPQHYAESLRMPIPWDEVYLAKWEEFINAFGERYNGNPDIYSIQMTGGGHIGEMNLPKAHKKWQQVGYSDEKLIAAWKRIINAYQKAFPDTPTNLDINEPLGRRSKVLEPVVSYVVATYPGKVYLQHNGLKEDLPKDHHIRQTLREASRKTLVGYQMLGGKGFLDKQVGDRVIAFRNALEDHASYVEVYASDVRDPGLKAALQFLASEANRK
jgi:hypothetical protein